MQRLQSSSCMRCCLNYGTLVLHVRLPVASGQISITCLPYEASERDLGDVVLRIYVFRLWLLNLRTMSAYVVPWAHAAINSSTFRNSENDWHAPHFFLRQFSACECQSASSCCRDAVVLLPPVCCSSACLARLLVCFVSSACDSGPFSVVIPDDI
jgi:hypothetical protein